MPSYPGQMPNQVPQYSGQMPSYPSQMPPYSNQGMPNCYPPTQQQYPPQGAYPPMPNHVDSDQRVNYYQQQTGVHAQQHQAAMPMVSRRILVFFTSKTYKSFLSQPLL